MKKTIKKTVKKVVKAEPTKAEMRIAICKDVIAQIKAEKYQCSSTYLEGHLDNAVDLSKSAKNYISKIKNCQVCAKGGLFLSYIRKFNNVTLSEITFNPAWRDNNHAVEFDADNDLIWKKLGRVFSIPQLNLIEAVYENYGMYNVGKDYSGPSRNIEADEYVERDLDRSDRLIAIMRNMIANDGILKKDPKLVAEVKVRHEDLTSSYWGVTYDK